MWRYYLLFVCLAVFIVIAFNEDPIETRTFTIKSNPSGVTIQATADTSGAGAGVTTFTRIYQFQGEVTLTAPATFRGRTFIEWRKNGVLETTNLILAIEADGNHTLTAVYTGESDRKFKGWRGLRGW